MKQITLLILFSLCKYFLYAQLTPEQRIQDSIIGWWSVLPKKATVPATNNGYTFSVAQQEHVNEIIRWMYKTYTPVAGLGTFKKDFDADLGAQKRYPPHQYGIEFRVWDVSFDKQWMTADGKFRPIDEQYSSFFVTVNRIPESKPVIFINTAERYVFTVPPNGSGNEQLKEHRKETDKRIHPNVYPFITMQSEFQNIFLAPGNKLPVKNVTKGELLDMAESSIDILLKTEWERVQQQFTNTTAQQDAFTTRKKVIEQHRLYIQQLRIKHKLTLDQPAIVNNADLTIYQFEINRDPFDINEIQKQRNQYYNVQQYTKELLDKCRTNQPQWITISVPFKTKEDGNQEYEMYKAVIENFNYEYMYNYFFNPEKIKARPNDPVGRGSSYKPANEESLKARLDAYRKKSNETATIVNKTSAPNILFEDDFSANASGANPKGWFISSTGEASKVSVVKTENGNWLKLGYNNPVSPFTFKKPLPQNFSITFDVATDKFNSRTGGAVTLYMSTYPLSVSGTENKTKDGAWIKLTIRAGNANDVTNNNFSGEAKLELHTTPPLFRENFNEGAFYTKSLTDFSNKKRKINVQLQFKNGEISLLINNQLAAASLKDMKLSYGGVCKDCRIPAGLVFNTIRWENVTNNANERGVYISNITIVKE